MTTRGPPNARGMNTRFAQFKLVLLGKEPSGPSLFCFLFFFLVCANVWRRRVCGRQGNDFDTHPEAAILARSLSLVNTNVVVQSSIVLRFVKVSI